jgi:hypothetical protein
VVVVAVHLLVVVGLVRVRMPFSMATSSQLLLLLLLPEVLLLLPEVLLLLLLLLLGGEIVPISR